VVGQHGRYQQGMGHVFHKQIFRIFSYGLTDCRDVFMLFFAYIALQWAEHS